MSPIFNYLYLYFFLRLRLFNRRLIHVYRYTFDSWHSIYVLLSLRNDGGVNDYWQVIIIIRDTRPKCELLLKNLWLQTSERGLLKILVKKFVHCHLENQIEKPISWAKRFKLQIFPNSIMVDVSGTFRYRYNSKTIDLILLLDDLHKPILNTLPLFVARVKHQLRHSAAARDTV